LARRRNDVVFAETETTVSREHAQIRSDVETGKHPDFTSGWCLIRERPASGHFIERVPRF
jgi:hypothetical protein